ncbi:MarR family winged helix-turn-helix transcriptional regulator [Solicola gregarius]|uniref:MarR family transcriptional regulator n=1 Tax=Solicola gregarius TaxID=2908642 RepID=A0AA46TLP3_9ACTN|nr:MarR family transcriptional regulator [Solicola gregarius]UYM07597.1 MarR family transcriptional regulator [Solicola gregarius]
MVEHADELHALLMDLGRVAAQLHPDEEVRGLSLTQLFALHELDAADTLSQRDLAERLRLEKSTVSRLVADLVRDGMITKERDPDNRRYSRLRITARGSKTHGRIGSGMHERFDRLAAELSPTERDALLAGLPGLVRALRNV